MVSTDSPVTESFICIIALKGHLENTVSLNMLCELEKFWIDSIE
jgi:hypothetical protein